MKGNHRNTEGKAALKAAVEAVEGAAQPLVTEITLDNGVVLKLKPVPPFLVRQAAINLKQPKPPVIDVGKGDGREEENPNDPEYLKKLDTYNAEVISASTNAMLLAGTEVLSVPDDMWSLDDDGWLELVEFLEIEVDRENKMARYLAWLRYYALSGPSITRIMAELRKSIGLTEEEVDDAVDSFRNRATRRAAERVSPETPRDRDNVPKSAARDRTRSRGKGSR